FGIHTIPDELYDPVEDVKQDLIFVSIEQTKKAYNEQIDGLIRGSIDNYRDMDMIAEESLLILNKFMENADYSLDFIMACFLLGKGHISEWKFRYYEHHYGAIEHQQELVGNMSYLYLESVMWVAKYYFEKCPDWSWEYVYTHAPFISDVVNYMESAKEFNINDI